MKIFHVINPYSTEVGSEDEEIQKRTLESLTIAKEYADSVVDVNFVMKVDEIEFDEFNKKYSSESFCVAPLKFTSQDLVTKFDVPRRLPILNDLIKLPDDIDAADDDYVIFTNMDICVQPFFYTEIARIIQSGHDSFVINRRTIAKELLSKPISESFIADGEKHIGHDCFIVPVKYLNKFYLQEHILGIGFVFRPFLLNCILNSINFTEFDSVYLTFHYGDDMEWKNEKYQDYLEHNRNMLIEVFTEQLPLINKGSQSQLEWISKFFPFDFLPSIEPIHV